MAMNLTTDAKQTVYLEDIPVGRLVDEGADQVFYVPGDGGIQPATAAIERDPSILQGEDANPGGLQRLARPPT
jgi:hypothetical protein